MVSVHAANNPALAPHAWPRRPAPAQPCWRSPRQRCGHASAQSTRAAEEGEGSAISASDVHSAAAGATAAASASLEEGGPLLLEVCGLSARVAPTRGHLTLKGGVRTGDGSAAEQQEQQILHGVSLAILRGEVRPPHGWHAQTGTGCATTPALTCTSTARLSACTAPAQAVRAEVHDLPLSCSMVVLLLLSCTTTTNPACTSVPVGSSTDGQEWKRKIHAGKGKRATIHGRIIWHLASRCTAQRALCRSLITAVVCTAQLILLRCQLPAPHRLHHSASGQR